MLIMYFNDLRDKGIKVNPEDTLWIDLFVNHVKENKLLSDLTIRAALVRTLEVINQGQSTKDVIELLRKFDIDYTPIDAEYLARLNEYNELFKK